MTFLTHTLEDGLATLTLTNPPQNRITPAMVGDLAAALDAVMLGGARALLVRADGPDFCFGGDIQLWPQMAERDMRAMLERHLAVFNRFERLAIPTVAAVQGLCFGGGLELAVRADVIFAAQSARFGHPEQSLGIVTLLGGAYRVAERAGRAKAMEWALTSEQVPAAEMERHGVVNRVVEDALLIQDATAFARRLASGPTLAHAAHKALLRTWAVGGLAAADEALLDVAMPLFRSEDVAAAVPLAVAAFKAGKPRPAFPFAGR